MSTQGQNTAPILVIGATGKTGRRVVERLQGLGRPARSGSRSSEIPFVWEDESTWEAALDGVSAAYVTYYPDLAFPGAKEAVERFAAFAVERGVRRLVLLSGRGEEGAVAGEDGLKASGCDWTVVRANWFNQNFSESFFLDPVRSGELALPTGDAVEPFVDADDIADVVVAALTDDRHIGKTYELSGPRLLSFHDVARELSAATGRTITYIPVSADDYRAALRELGEAEEFADLFTLIVDGRNASLVPGVREALGRGPKDFADYAKEAAATGVWHAKDEAKVEGDLKRISVLTEYMK
ncbi:NmrA family NAD(P)-binding protein [Streptomyces eurythermus]